MEVDNSKPLVVIDAVPQRIPTNISINQNQVYKRDMIKTVFSDLTVEEYKSLFFLLMDYIGVDEFLNLSNKEKSYLEEEFCKIYEKLNNDILIELFGTMKMFKKLRMLGACCHVYKSLQETKFNNIRGIWKMLYSLCEELTSDDLEIFKQTVQDNIRNQISTAEDWFCWGLKKNFFSETDYSKLEVIFNHYPKCQDIIQKFKVKMNSYDIRIPTTTSDIGIALIMNFEEFSEESNFSKREGSDVDVHSLEELWNVFGFKTKVYPNLTYAETLEILKYYAALDHSNYDAFVCCILSHGKSNAVISSDGIPMPIPELIAQITNECLSLASKPKLFFIQACQGTNIPQGVGKPVFKLKTADECETVSSSDPPIASDVLLGVSSIDGFVSFLDVKNGSWFISSLYKSLMEYGDKLSILDVMIKVNAAVSNRSADFGPGGPRSAQQIVNCSNTFGKTLILKKRIH